MEPSCQMKSANHIIPSLVFKRSCNTQRVEGSPLRPLTARNLGWGRDEILQCVQRLTRSDFYKSMTSYHNLRLRQDVYRPIFKGKDLYVKVKSCQGNKALSFPLRNIFPEEVHETETSPNGRNDVCPMRQARPHLRRRPHALNYKGSTLKIENYGVFACPTCGKNTLMMYSSWKQNRKSAIGSDKLTVFSPQTRLKH